VAVRRMMEVLAYPNVVMYKESISSDNECCSGYFARHPIHHLFDDLLAS